MAGHENLFSQDYPTSRYFNLTQVLTGFGSTFEASKPGFTLRCSLLRLLFFYRAHGWCKCESAQPSTGLES